MNAQIEFPVTYEPLNNRGKRAMKCVRMRVHSLPYAGVIRIRSKGLVSDRRTMRTTTPSELKGECRIVVGMMQGDRGRIGVGR